MPAANLLWPDHAQLVDLPSTTPEWLRTSELWPPTLGRDTSTGQIGYVMAVFCRRDNANYTFEAPQLVGVVSPCENGHFPEAVMYGADPDGPWLCRSCRFNEMPGEIRPTIDSVLASIRSEAQQGRYPAKGSTPPITEYQAVVIADWGAFQADKFGDGNPALRFEPEDLLKVVAAERAGVVPIRYGLLFWHLAARRFDSKLGIASWWDQAHAATVSWYDTTWPIPDIKHPLDVTIAIRRLAR